MRCNTQFVLKHVKAKIVQVIAMDVSQVFMIIAGTVTAPVQKGMPLPVQKMQKYLWIVPVNAVGTLC